MSSGLLSPRDTQRSGQRSPKVMSRPASRRSSPRPGITRGQSSSQGFSFANFNMPEKQKLPLPAYHQHKHRRLSSRSITQGALTSRWISIPLTLLAASLFSYCFFQLAKNLLSWPASDSYAPDAGATPRPIIPQKTNHATWDGWHSVENFFVFGDSYSSTDFDPRGREPRPENPFGNPDQFQFDGTIKPKEGPRGPLWIHSATMKHNESLIRTYNLAKGGATVDRAFVDPVFPTATTLVDQVEKLFLPTYYPEGAKAVWSDTRSLFAMWFGMTDVIISYHDLKRTPSDLIMESYILSIAQLYKSGARNFLLLNVPPLNRAYKQTNIGVAELKSDIADMNKRIIQMRNDIIEQYKDANVFLFDTHTLFEDVTRAPKTFDETAIITFTGPPCPSYDLGIGAEEGAALDRFDGKCGIPVSQYLWHDSMHTTYPIHALLGKLIVEDCMGEQRKRYCS